MRIKNDQAGLTLVELLVTILIGSIVTLAATTVLLLGLRINNQSTQTTVSQNTVQALMTALNRVAEEENLAVEMNNPGETPYWRIVEPNPDAAQKKVLFSYDSENKVICVGADTPFLKGVEASTAELNKDKKLLTVSVTVNGEEYTSTIYCRLLPETAPASLMSFSAEMNAETYASALPEEEADAAAEALVACLRGETVESILPLPEDLGRRAFLQILASQQGSRGQIRSALGNSGETWYSEWYVGGYENHPDWNRDTPWCACFLSWAMDQTIALVNPPKEAHVDKLMAHFEVQSAPEAGDLIFFDWDSDGVPQHVGAVLCVEGGRVYTIEGNVDGKVALRHYAADDYRIVGYGCLPWN